MSYLEIGGVVIAATACLLVFWLYFKSRRRETPVSEEDRDLVTVNAEAMEPAIDAEDEIDR